MLRPFIIMGVSMLAIASLGAQSVDDLLITEVSPISDEVEVTNISTGSVTAPNDLPFSALGVDGVAVIPSGETFLSGESRIFSVPLNDAASDLWLYRNALDFNAGSNMIGGLQYGAGGQGRVAVAVSAMLWTSNGDFVPAPGAGQTIQLNALVGTVPANHIAHAPRPGTFFGDGMEIPNPLPPIPDGTIQIELETVATGLVSPIGVVQPDDGSGRLFIYDQIGLVRVVDSGGTLLGTPLLDTSSRQVSPGAFGPGTFDERGLIGFAVHPDFASNGKVYTYTSEPVSATAAVDFTTSTPATPNHQAVISEWQVTGTITSDPVNPATRRELMRIDQPQFNHNGGTLRFGPDGMLFIALGDGGSADDQGAGHPADGNGQDNTTIYGSILRIDVDQAVGTPSANGQYNIPPDNPFAGGPGVEEIYLFGLRNPFLFSFDRGFTDPMDWRMYVADVGQNDIEEIDLITPMDAGANLGWRLKEGSFFFDPNGGSPGIVTTIPVAPIPADVLDPIAEYDHGNGSMVDNGISVSGGFVYRGGQIPELDGLYVFGDFGTAFAVPSGRLWYLDGSNQVRELIIGPTDRALDIWLKGIGEDQSGAIYFCGSEDIGPSGTSGVVLRLIPDPTVPAELSILTAD